MKARILASGVARGGALHVRGLLHRCAAQVSLVAEHGSEQGFALALVAALTMLDAAADGAVPRAVILSQVLLVNVAADACRISHRVIKVLARLRAAACVAIAARCAPLFVQGVW